MTIPKYQITLQTLFPIKKDHVKFYIGCVLCLLFGTISFGQDTGKHQLLWEIKHKNTNKVSYLYGTIHLQDKRVFNFSDSLIPAIKRSEVFALEIHPDSVMPGLISTLLVPDSNNIYKEVLSVEEYALLSERFEAINNTPLEDFYTKNPFIIESLLTQETSKIDDMPNFLDGYLYGIAYTNNLKIAGLERLEDQMPEINTLDSVAVRETVLEILSKPINQVDAQLEQMIALYINGDLDAFLDYINAYDGIDERLIKRNLVMLNSMIKIMQTQSLFAAVGTAHLPGEQGLIALLKKNGYTVKPVPVTFNQKIESPPLIPNLSTWITNDYPDKGFRVKTSTAPVLTSKNNVDSFYAIDLISGSDFGYYVFDLNKLGAPADLDVSALFSELFLEEGNIEVISQEQVSINGRTFDQTVVKQDQDYYRYVLKTLNGKLYIFFTESVYLAINSPYNNAFFESIELFDLELKTPPNSNVTWTNFTKPLAGFAVDLPNLEVKTTLHETPNPIDPDGEPFLINMYAAVNQQGPFNYFIRYNDQPIGYYAKDYSNLEADLIEILGNSATVYKKAVPVTVNGNKGISMQFILNGKYHVVLQLLMRGNRTYLLMEQSNSKDQLVDPNSRFFSSFELLDLEPPVFGKTVTVKDQFTLDFPESVKLFETETYTIEDEFEVTNNYAAVAASSGDAYMMQVTSLSKLYRTIDKDSFFKESLEAIKEEGDSIIAINDRVLAGFPGKTAIIKNSNTSVMQIAHIMYVNNYLVTLYGYLGQEGYKAKHYDTFLIHLKN